MEGLLFETERLRVRRMVPEDLAALIAVYSDPVAMRWVDDGEPISPGDAERWVEVTHANYRKRGYGMSVVESRESGATLGFCGLVHPGGQDQVEIKYALLRSHWGQGLGTEVASGMIAYGQREFGMERIIATVDAGNAASLHVLAKVGMVEESRTREDDEVVVLLAWEAARG